MSGVASDPFEFDAVLSDGRTVHVRPMRPDDGERLLRFHGRLSPDTIHLRFFSAHPRLSEKEVAHFTHLDGRDRAALVATVHEEIVAVVRYDRTPGSNQAEVAFVVDDAHQGRGIATLLLEHLAALARHNGISSFVAETLAENSRMQGVFRAAGFTVRSVFDRGTVHVEFPIVPDETFLEAMENRERRADRAALMPILRPRSIMVVGTDDRLVQNLVTGGFGGAVFTEGPPDDGVDLAVIAVGSISVEAAIDTCGSRGARGAIVLTADIDDPAGVARAARRHQMRVVGPASIGIVNTAIAMNATTVAVVPASGRIGFGSQSAHMGTSALERMNALGLGVSTFVSLGDKADVSGNDLLLFWEDDDDTDLILLSLESFGNPQKFVRIARRVSQRKPVVALAGTDPARGDLFREAGVITVATLEELLDVGALIDAKPVANQRTPTSFSDEEFDAYLRRLR